MACGLPAPTGGPSPVDGSPAAPDLTPTATAEPAPPPSDFAAVLEAEVAAGEIRYEDGLIRLLRAFLGDPEVTLPAAYGDVVTNEGNSIVESAGDYIAGGTDEAAKAEMRRLLDLLIPTNEQLEAYSRPAEAGLGGPGQARPLSQVDCADLWRAGFPLAGVTTYPCFAYVRGTVSGAASYTLYYPTAWAVDDARRAKFELARSAVDEALLAFRAHGAFDDISIIFSMLPGAADFLATTHPYEGSRRETCPIMIYPLGLALDDGPFQQTVAHEIFHCFEFHNLPEQMEVPHSINQWWSEASAEYFSNVVYPGVNYEYRWVDSFDFNSKTTPLHLLSYENFGFFQFLANRWGDTGVITFLESMPTSGGSEEQLARLAAWPGMQDVFHDFGQDYLDFLIADSGGDYIPFGPATEHTLHIPRGAHVEEITPQPFVLDRRSLVFADDTRFTVGAEPSEGEGRHSASLAGHFGSWAPLPSTVNTACGENRYLLLVTSAVAGGSSPMVLTLQTEGEPLEESTACDACLIGNWELSNASYLSHAGPLWDIVVAAMPSQGADATPTSVFGRMSIQFREDGTASGVQEGWGIAGVVTREEKRIDTRITYNGTGEANWRVEVEEDSDRHFLFFEEGVFDLFAQMTFEGFPLASRPTGGSNDPVFLSSPQPYLCDETTLTFNAEDPLGPIWFLRAPPPAEAP